MDQDGKNQRKKKDIPGSNEACVHSDLVQDLKGEHLIALISSHLIYPWTARVVGAPQMIPPPVSSIFPCSPLPSGTWRTPGLSFSWCCLPTSSSVCLVFSLPFTVPCKMGLARPDERETWPYHCSLCRFTIVRMSSCGPIACWILARTSSLVTWSLYEMRSILR